MAHFAYIADRKDSETYVFLITRDKQLPMVE